MAALVSKLGPAETGLQLVNTSTKAARRLVVQAGAFGEHRFSEVKVLDRMGTESILSPHEWLSESKTISERVVQVGGRHFAVELPPSTTVRLEAGVRRFANRPSYALPWK